MTDATKWLPQELDDADVAFSTRVDHLMPPYAEIPQEFKRGHGKWNDVASTWFFKGLKGAVFTPKPGIDQRTALRHLRAIQGSFEPKHEHKDAAVAFLLSEWFDDVQMPDVAS